MEMLRIWGIQEEDKNIFKAVLTRLADDLRVFGPHCRQHLAICGTLLQHMNTEITPKGQ